jgi:hypothetical protein
MESEPPSQHLYESLDNDLFWWSVSAWLCIVYTAIMPQLTDIRAGLGKAAGRQVLPPGMMKA